MKKEIKNYSTHFWGQFTHHIHTSAYRHNAFCSCEIILKRRNTLAMWKAKGRVSSSTCSVKNLSSSPLLLYLVVHTSNHHFLPLRFNLDPAPSLPPHKQYSHTTLGWNPLLVPLSVQLFLPDCEGSNICLVFLLYNETVEAELKNSFRSSV